MLRVGACVLYGSLQGIITDDCGNNVWRVRFPLSGASVRASGETLLEVMAPEINPNESEG